MFRPIWDAHVIDFYKNHNVSHMFGLVSVTVDQVSSILNSIIASKATGLDELPARLIKDGSSVIAKPLTHIVNLSITTGTIPDDLKVLFHCTKRKVRLMLRTTGQFMC